MLAVAAGSHMASSACQPAAPALLGRGVPWQQPARVPDSVIKLPSRWTTHCLPRKYSTVLPAEAHYLIVPCGAGNRARCL